MAKKKAARTAKKTTTKKKAAKKGVISGQYERVTKGQYGGKRKG